MSETVQLPAKNDPRAPINGEPIRKYFPISRESAGATASGIPGSSAPLCRDMTITDTNATLAAMAIAAPEICFAVFFTSPINSFAGIFQQNAVTADITQNGIRPGFPIRFHLTAVPGAWKSSGKHSPGAVAIRFFIGSVGIRLSRVTELKEELIVATALPRFSTFSSRTAP